MSKPDATEGDTSGKTGADGKEPAKQTDNSAEPQNGKTSDGNGRMFTQDELDAILEKRLAKEKKKWTDTKDLSDAERLKAENAELRRELISKNAAEKFETAAAKQGVKNTRGLYRAVAGDLDIDDNGKIKNLEDVLKDAKKELPEFFGAGSLGDADAGKGGDGGKAGGGSMNDFIRAGFGRL